MAAHVYTKKEEVANAITHGIGVVFSLFALFNLISTAKLYGNVWHQVSFTLFGTTMLILYMSSTLVHALPNGKAKQIVEIIDHSSIYFFIAGSFTPLLFIVVEGWQSWALLTAIWAMAVAGTIFKCFFVNKFIFTSTFLYIAMGWSIVLVWNEIVQKLAYEGIVLLVAGGLFYTFGTIFYMWRCFKYHHAIWHIFVLAGTVMHFFGILTLL